jgi:hypothetical protein
LLRLCLVDLICAGVVLLSLSVMSRAVTSEWSRLDGLTHAGRPYALTASAGGTVGQGVSLVSSSDSIPHPTYTFPLQNSVVSNLESKLVIFYIKNI